jgi:hypothetical protein
MYGRREYRSSKLTFERPCERGSIQDVRRVVIVTKLADHGPLVAALHVAGHQLAPLPLEEVDHAAVRMDPEDPAVEPELVVPGHQQLPEVDAVLGDPAARVALPHAHLQVVVLGGVEELDAAPGHADVPRRRAAEEPVVAGVRRLRGGDPPPAVAVHGRDHRLDGAQVQPAPVVDAAALVAQGHPVAVRPPALPVGPGPRLRRVDPHRGAADAHRHEVALEIEDAVGAPGRVEREARGGARRALGRGVRHGGQLVGGGVAHGVVDLAQHRGVPAADQEVAVAALDAVEARLVPGRERREGRRVDRWRLAAAAVAARARGRAGELEGLVGGLVVFVAGPADVEEAGEGLGHHPAVAGVADEVAPVPGDAPEAVERPGRQPRQDVQDEVVVEPGRGGGRRRRPRCPRRLPSRSATARVSRRGQWNGA